jgi:hypothetical protein
MIMKLISCLGTLAALTVAHSARADFMFTVNAAIPEGNPVGVTSGGTVSGLADGSTIASLSVGLNISGGYNGDLYGYLVAPGGNSVVLLNQPGVTPDDPFGYGGSGYNITLVDAATLSLQNTPEVDGVPVVGTFQPAGQLSSLNGINGNGTWTL